MRINILVLALLSSAASAQAGSIDAIKTGKDVARSIETISCGGCVARAAKKEEPVVELAPGTQKVEIRDVGGVKKIFRTEAWLGGSPVTYVSKALPEDVAVATDAQTTNPAETAAAQESATNQPAVSAEIDMIDEKSTTAAVTADKGAAVKVDVAPKTAGFDPGTMELRLD